MQMPFDVREALMPLVPNQRHFCSEMIILQKSTIQILLLNGKKAIGRRFRQSELHREWINMSTGKQFNLTNKYSYCMVLLVDGIIQSAISQKSKSKVLPKWQESSQTQISQRTGYPAV